VSAKKSRPWQGAAGATSDDDNTILAAAADKSRPAGAAAAHPPHSLLEQHERLLEKSGIPLQFAREHGIRSASAAEDLPQNLRWAAAHENALPGLLITWRTVDGGVNYQLRPDKPPVIKGEPRKYLQPNNVRLLNVLGDPAQSDMLFLVEGSKQGYAAAAHAPKGVLVVAIPGCRGWSHERKLLPELARLVQGRRVVCSLDADVGSNVNVRTAATALIKALKDAGASAVLYARNRGQGTDGLDDVLGQRPPKKRRKLVRKMIHSAVPDLPAMASLDHPTPLETAEGVRPVINLAAERLQVTREVVDCLLRRWDARLACSAMAGDCASLTAPRSKRRTKPGS